jgi:hypothetical protein
LSCEQALYFVQPRSEIFWIANKIKTLFLFSRAAKNFGIYQQMQLKSTNCILFWGQKHCILFSRAAKFFGIANKHCILFCHTADLELPTKDTQMNCLQLSRKREREEKVDRWKQ